MFTELKSAVLLYMAAAIIVALGVNGIRPLFSDGTDVTLPRARFDGTHYAHIALSGYAYTPVDQSSVAFFPGFPLLGWVLLTCCKCGPERALLLVSNACLLVSCALFTCYLRQPPNIDLSGGIQGGVSNCLEDNQRSREYAVLAFLLFPINFFLHMAYSESLFILMMLLTMLGIRRQWPLITVALLCGLATAVRPVGVAIVPPVIAYCWSISSSCRNFVFTSVAIMPVCCGGLLAYMCFQYWQFGDALAFARTQTHWRILPDVPVSEKVLALVSFEPIWHCFARDSPGYWANLGSSNPLFNLQLVNPLVFVGTFLCVCIGFARRWLTGAEVFLAIGLLGIPYVTKSYEMCMNSHARFSAIVFPMYIVLGELLSRCGILLATMILSISACLLCIYAALFSAGYPFF